MVIAIARARWFAFTLLAVVGALGGAVLAAPADNTLEIVVSGGPNAGTYRPPPAEILCWYFTTQKTLGAVYKDFDVRDPKKIGEAGINIDNPDDAGTKRGTVLVNFGAPGDKGAVKYSISIPKDSAGPLTLMRSGKSAELTFQGKTKDGVSIRVTAKCPELEVV